MKEQDFFNHSTPSEQNFFAPMLLVALALHGVLLMLPVGADSGTPESPENEQNTQVQPFESASTQQVPSQPLKVHTTADTDEDTDEEEKTPSRPTPMTQRPQSQTASDPNQNQKTSSPQRQQTRSQSTASRPVRSQRHRQSTTSTSSPATQSVSPPPSEESNSEPPTVSEELNPESLIASATPQLESLNLPPAEQQPETPLRPKPLLITPGTFLTDFPYYLGSLMTSGGILNPKFNDSTYIYHTSDNLKDVAIQFEEKLRDKGFQVTANTNEDNFRVYEVSRGETTHYLHLVFKDGKTAILLDTTKHNLNELSNETLDYKKQNIVEFYDSFEQTIRNHPELNLQPLRPSDLSLFYQAEVLKKFNDIPDHLEFAKHIENLLLNKLQGITSSSNPIPIEQLASRISTALSQGDEGFTMEEVGTYAGGNLYAVTKGDFKIYMILVSTQGENISRTGILFSRSDPQN